MGGVLQNIFEGAKITVRIKIAKGMPKAKTAKIQFIRIERDGTLQDLDPIDVKITKHTFGANEFKTEFEAPLVGEAKASSYRLAVKLVLGKKEYYLPDQWNVWRDHISIEAKRKIDGELTTAGNVILLLFKGEEEPKGHRIPMNGKCQIQLDAPPGPFSINLEAPARLVKYLDSKEKGAERCFEYEVAPAKARIVAPAGGALRRYVNIDSNTVELEIETVALAGFPKVGNQKVYFQVEFKNPTIRGKGSELNGDDEFAKEATVDQRHAPTKEGIGRNDTVWKGVLTTDHTGKGVLQIHLGKGGGESCEIKLGTTETLEDAAISFETWRKIYIQYWSTGSKLTDAWPLKDRTYCTESLAKVFIEAEYLPDGTLTKDGTLSPTTVPIKESWFAEDRSGWYPGSDFGLKEQEILLFNVGGSTWKNVCNGIVQDLHPKKEGLLVIVAMPDISVDYHPYVARTAIETQDFVDPQKKKKVVETYKGAERLLVHKTGKEVVPRNDLQHFGKLPRSKKYQKASFAKAEVRIDLGAKEGDWTSLDPKEIVIDYDKKEKEGDKPVKGHLRILLPDSAKTLLEDAAKELKDLFSQLDTKSDNLIKLTRERSNINKKKLFEVDIPLDKLPPPTADTETEKKRTRLTEEQAKLKKQLDQKTDEYKVVAKEVSDLKSQLDPKIVTVRVRWDVLLCDDCWAAGISDGKQSIILGEKGKPKESNSTIIHELGHAIGMVASVYALATGNKSMVVRLPGYAKGPHPNPKAKQTVFFADQGCKELLHPRVYTKRGGVGSHCAEGCSQSTYDSWKELSGSSFKCVMYGCSTSKAPTDYCQHCSKIIQAMEIWIGDKSKP